MKKAVLKKILPMTEKKVLGRALFFSVFLHLGAALLFSVTAIPEVRAPDFVDLSMIPVKNLWMEHSLSPEPSMRAISFVEIIRKAAAPRLELYHRTYLWEDDIAPLISPTTNAIRWDFRKEQPDYWFIFDKIRIRSDYLTQKTTDELAEIEKSIAVRRVPGIHISGPLGARKLLGRRALPDAIKEAAGISAPLFSLRVGVDSDGNVRQAALEKSSGDTVLDEQIRRMVYTWRFEPALVETGITWGVVEIVPSLSSNDSQETTIPNNDT